MGVKKGTWSFPVSGKEICNCDQSTPLSLHDQIKSFISLGKFLGNPRGNPRGNLECGGAQLSLLFLSQFSQAIFTIEPNKSGRN